MIQVLREFLVKQKHRDQFELAYGPGGAWSQLFAGSAGFRGISVLRHQEELDRHLTIEMWDSEEQRQQSLAAQPAGVAEVEANLAEWSVAATEFGVFKSLSQATVKPKPRR